jgi:glyoxylase-like metal-dependent hydrolase (beta-lactamase superfamily II)
MSAHEILAVRYGTVHSTKSDLFLRYGSYREPDAPQDMDFFFYVLRRDGEVTLIDTGFAPADAPPRGRECLIAPEDALATMGIERESVARVIVTHCHWDHIGNLDLFTNADLYVPERELEFWSAPVARNVQFWAHTEEHAIAQVERARLQKRVSATGADEEIVPGIRVISVGGHSPGQQIVVVDGTVILASDAAHLYEELELERPFGVVVDLREMVEAYALIKELAAAPGAVVVPGHDPLVAERFPTEDFAVRIA